MHEMVDMASRFIKIRNEVKGSKGLFPSSVKKIAPFTFIDFMLPCECPAAAKESGAIRDEAIKCADDLEAKLQVTDKALEEAKQKAKADVE